MCSELTPRAPIPDTRIPQLMQPCCGLGAKDSRGVLEGVVERGDLYGRGAAVRLKSAISHLLDQASYLPPPSIAWVFLNSPSQLVDGTGTYKTSCPALIYLRRTDQGSFSRQSDDLTKYQSNVCRWCILPYCEIHNIAMQLRDTGKLKSCCRGARFTTAIGWRRRRRGGAMKIILDRHRADAFE